MTEWDGPDMRETGVDTEGCDCGHDGMALGWHVQGCHWRDATEAQERWEHDRLARLTDAQLGLVAALRAAVKGLVARLLRKGTQ